MRIGSNDSGLSVLRNLGLVNKALARTLERLSTGRRVNSSRDDASSLAQEIGLQSQIRAFKQIDRNINDGLSALYTADSILGAQTELVQRMRELAVQASSGILATADRQNLQVELESLLSEFDRLAESTTFNGINLLDGSFTDIGLQITPDKNQQTTLSIADSRGGNTFEETFNYGIGTFTLLSTGDSPISNPANIITTNDFNNDGLKDILTRTSASPTTATIQISNGDGTFTTTATLAMAASQTIQSAIDLNNDGVLDIYATSGTGTVRVYYGLGDGSFSSTAQNITTSFASFGTPSDENGDGLLDFVGYNSATGAAGIVYQNASGTFTVGTTVSAVKNLNFFTTADLNGDDRSDIFVRSQGGNQDVIQIYLQQANGSFSGGATMVVTDNTFGSSVSANLVDLDNDGDLDIQSWGSGTSILYNNGAGSFTVRQTLAHAITGTPTDLDGDGRLDLAVANAGVLSIYFMTASKAYPAATSFALPSASYGLGHMIDMDGDGDIDIVANNSTAGIVNVFSNNGSGSFSLTASTGVHLASHTLDTPVDMNGDGLLDLVARRNALDSYWFSYQKADGTFEDRILMHTGVTNRNLGLLDANDDGSLDLVFAGTTSPSFAIYLQNEEATYAYLRPSVETASDAQNSLAVIDRALENINSRRSQIGSLTSRLESSAQTGSITRENLEVARSNLVDANIAQEMAELVRLQILQQVQISIAAQSNLQRQLVLDLLRN